MSENRSDYGIICLCAMRYALGRQTYMPGLVQDYIKSNIADIETRDITTMIRDIDEANKITEHKMSDGSVLKFDGLGDTNIDRPGWERFRAFLMGELEKRQNGGAK